MAVRSLRCVENIGNYSGLRKGFGKMGRKRRKLFRAGADLLGRFGNAEFDGGLAVLGLTERRDSFSSRKKGHLMKLTV